MTLAEEVEGSIHFLESPHLRGWLGEHRFNLERAGPDPARSGPDRRGARYVSSVCSARTPGQA